MPVVFFFSLPAHGHVNPTLPVVRELVSRGATVRYYDTPEFQAAIEAAGAQFADIAPFMPPAPKDVSKVARRDFAALVEMAADTTLGLSQTVARDIAACRPDVIVSDSVCFWGKLLAKRHGIPFICSTTSLAFNEHTAGRMKQSPAEILRMTLGMPRMNAAMARLRAGGFPAGGIPDLVGNDSQTDTLVFTSRRFQPESDTFGERYAFVGPSVARTYPRQALPRPRVYISLGTILNNAPAFYRRCFAALRDLPLDVILSCGACPAESLYEIPENFTVRPRVNQLEVLASCDVFLTHCGMNSASESLLCGTPMVLFPQHSEETAVANRVLELGAGVRLRRATVRGIRAAVGRVLAEPSFAESARALQRDFLACGGPQEAAAFILERAGKHPDARNKNARAVT